MTDYVMEEEAVSKAAEVSVRVTNSFVGHGGEDYSTEDEFSGDFFNHPIKIASPMSPPR